MQSPRIALQLPALLLTALLLPLGSCSEGAKAKAENIGAKAAKQNGGGTPKDGPQRTLRLGTWNLEHFGQRDKFQDRPNSPKNRTPEEVKQVAAFLKGMQFDVLALQEIGGPEPLQKLLPLLGADYRFVLGTTGIYGKTRISVGFLWNDARVELVQVEEMADFPRKVGDLSVFHRKPVNAVFRSRKGGYDFRAIVVHLKASKGRKNEQKRTAEVGVLREYIQKLQADANEDQDIVVLGDFNHTYGAPAHQAFQKDDLVRYARPTQTSDVPSPTIIWFDDPIDHIALTKGIRDDVRAKSFRRHTQEAGHTAADKGKITEKELTWRQTYSDHFPVTIELNAGKDGDPDATFRAPQKTLPVGK